MDLSRLHLHWTARKKQGKEYRVYSLARSVRSGSKVRKQIIIKLGKLTAAEIDQWRQVLHNLKQLCKTKTTSIDLTPENNFSYEDLQKLIKEAEKKQFDYAEVDRDLDVELYKKVTQQAFVELISWADLSTRQYDKILGSPKQVVILKNLF